MKVGLFAISLLFVIFYSCTGSADMQQDTTSAYPAFDLQGHRGARGLMPENTIPGFIYALQHGITTIEADLMITADQQVVVSHDPVLNTAISSYADGRLLQENDTAGRTIYRLSYEQLKNIDVGRRQHPNFPRQQTMPAIIPLLEEAIDSIERHAKASGIPVRYNLEIKSKPSGDGIHHPDPETFARLVIAVLEKKGISARTSIQSFDPRPLRYLHEHHDDLMLSFLVEGEIRPVDQLLDTLGFIPDIISPHYSFINPEFVRNAHAKNIRVIPWTVNDLKVMQQLTDMIVDGLISDYPDLYSSINFQKSP